MYCHMHIRAEYITSLHALNVSLYVTWLLENERKSIVVLSFHVLKFPQLFCMKGGGGVDWLEQKAPDKMQVS